jgi:flagellar motor switch protein FliM
VTNPADAATAAADVPGALPGSARTYDFRRPTRLSREHVRVLEIASDTLTRQWTTLLTTTLREVCSASLGGVSQMSYDEYISGLETPTALFLLTLDPMPGVGMFEISHPVAMAMVDHLLGGPGGGAQPTRSFSEIEGTLLTGVVDRCLAELGYSFEGVMPITATVADIEQSPQFAQAASPSDSFIVLTYELVIGSVSCSATLALPFSDVFACIEKSLQGSASGRERADREAAVAAVTARIGDTRVEVAMVIGPTLVRLSDIVKLGIGDVIRLSHSVSEPLTLTTAGVTFAYAVPGSEGSRKAGLVVHSTEVTR